MLFGRAPIKPRKLLQILVEKVPEEAKRLGNGNDRTWTKAAKNVLCSAAGQLEFYAAVTFKGKRYHEWLLDAIWFGPNGDVLLAVESEWGRTPQAVLDDFAKLMCTKAPLKLMLFQVPKNRGDEIASRIGDKLNEYGQNVPGEHYLLINFANGEHQCWELELHSNGGPKKPGVRLRSVPSLSGPD